MRRVMAVCLVCVGVALAGCDDDGEPGEGDVTTDAVMDTASPDSMSGDTGGGDADMSGCVEDSECGRGLVCQNTRCAEVTCSADADCNSPSRTCLGNVCTAVECVTDANCDAGQTCADRVCADM